MRLLLLLFISTLRKRIDSPAERDAPLPTTTTGCVKINNCSPRSRLIGERRTRRSEFIYLLPIIRSRTAKAFARGIERNGAGISPPHYITHGVGTWIKIRLRKGFASTGGIRGRCFALLREPSDDSA